MRKYKFLTGWDWTEVADQIQNKYTHDDDEAELVIREALSCAFNHYCCQDNKVDRKAKRIYDICKEYNRRLIERDKKELEAGFGGYDLPMWEGLYKVEEPSVYLQFFGRFYTYMWT